jgi:hypothetical protein
MVREIPLARYTWELLKPLESNADTINVERHLPTQFQLAPPKAEIGLVYPGYSNIHRADSQRPHGPKISSLYHNRPTLPRSNSPDRSRLIPQTVFSPQSPSFLQKLDTPQIEHSLSDNITYIDGALSANTQRMAGAQRASNGAIQSPFSPNFVGTGEENQPRIEQSTSTILFEPVPFRKSQTVPLAAPPEKGWSIWRSKLTGLKRDSFGSLGDTSSLPSTTQESQRLEEISLKSLTNAAKISVRGKSTKNINVYLSQNSTYALFWTQPSIHIWDVGTSPPTIRRAISTESTCVLAAMTKVYLAYIIGTRDQKLTVIYLANVPRTFIFTNVNDVASNRESYSAISACSRVSYAIITMVPEDNRLPKGELCCCGI